MFVSFDQRQRLASAYVVSCAYHVGAIVLILVVVRSGTRAVRDAAPAAVGMPRFARLLPSGDGLGGGGEGDMQPPRRVESPGRDATTVPVTRPAPVVPAPTPRVPEADPAQRIVSPLEPQASGLDSLLGTLLTFSSEALSQGPGHNGGVGMGDRGGDGPGYGPGVGDGPDGAFEGGPTVVGDALPPRVLTMARPQYTAAAMQARIQGVVILACVVQPDGSVSDARVARSLDSMFGLDQEAIAAARRWRFLPGTHRGRPVATRVTIEVAFTLR